MILLAPAAAPRGRDWVDYATLIVAGSALLVSLVFGMRQARLARRLREIEEGRRHEEQEPRLAGQLDENRQTVTLANLGPVDLKSLDVARVPHAADPARIVSVGRGQTNDDRLGSLEVGGSADLVLDYSDGPGGVLRLRCTSTAAGVERPWKTLVEVTVPGTPNIFVI